MPKRRRKARGRPQSPQRLCRRLVKIFLFARSCALLSRGFSFSFLSLTLFAVVAISVVSSQLSVVSARDLAGWQLTTANWQFVLTL
jgi:hypothetical protein